MAVGKGPGWAARLGVSAVAVLMLWAFAGASPAKAGRLNATAGPARGGPCATAGRVTHQGLHGTMHVGNLVLASGSCYRVTSSLTVMARGSVVIEKPLALSPGAGLTIDAAGGIIVKAPIEQQPGAKPVVARASSSFCPDTDPIVLTAYHLPIEVDDPITGLNGGTVDGVGCPGQSVYLTAFSSALQGVVAQRLIARYVPATVVPAIARVFGIAGLGETSETLHVLAVLLSIPSGVIAVHAKIQAGDGGPGAISYKVQGSASYECHQFVGQKTVLFGGRGGRGGDVTLSTFNLGLFGGGIGTGSGSPDDGEFNVVNGYYVHPGSGGRGGSIGTAFAAASAPPGGSGQEGGDIVADTGGGGDGGLGTLNAWYAVRSNKVAYHSGHGGGPGDAFVNAGGGGLPNCNGGDAVIKVGQPGLNANIPGEGRPSSPVPDYAGVQVSGGDVNGGNANPGPATSPSDAQGGAGGSVTIEAAPLIGAINDLLPFGFKQNPNDPTRASDPALGEDIAWDTRTEQWDATRTGRARSRAAKVPYTNPIRITSVGNGGLGFYGCPNLPGGGGGMGGALNTAGALATVTNSFNGGNGNNGMGPGGAGPQGTRGLLSSAPLQNDLIKNSFQPGSPGGGCPTTLTPPAPSGTALETLTNGSGSTLAYSIQANGAANAYEITLPTGDAITRIAFPSGFMCTDMANVEMCTGSVEANTPLTGSFGHTGTISASCQCAQIAFSANMGATWGPSATFTGPPANSPQTPTSLTETCPATSTPSMGIPVSGTLTATSGSGTQPIADATVMISSNLEGGASSVRATAITNSSGDWSATVLPTASGMYTTVASFGGNSEYSSSQSTACATTVGG
jgi:hypothetical protein